MGRSLRATLGPAFDRRASVRHKPLNHKIIAAVTPDGHKDTQR
jgi:hypothetical protein